MSDIDWLAEELRSAFSTLSGMKRNCGKRGHTMIRETEAEYIGHLVQVAADRLSKFEREEKLRAAEKAT